MDAFVCVGNKDLKKAIFNRRGEQVAPLQLAEMQYEGNGLFWMVKHMELGKTGLIDTAGRTLMPFEFAECRLVREEDGFLSFLQNGWYSFLQNIQKGASETINLICF